MSYLCSNCLALGDERSFTYSTTLCDNCQPDGTTCNNKVLIPAQGMVF